MTNRKFSEKILREPVLSGDPPSSVANPTIISSAPYLPNRCCREDKSFFIVQVQPTEGEELSSSLHPAYLQDLVSDPTAGHFGSQKGR